MQEAQVRPLCGHLSTAQDKHIERNFSQFQGQGPLPVCRSISQHRFPRIWTAESDRTAGYHPAWMGLQGASHPMDTQCCQVPRDTRNPNPGCSGCSLVCGGSSPGTLGEGKIWRGPFPQPVNEAQRPRGGQGWTSASGSCTQMVYGLDYGSHSALASGP